MRRHDSQPLVRIGLDVDWDAETTTAVEVRARTLLLTCLASFAVTYAAWRQVVRLG